MVVAAVVVAAVVFAVVVVVSVESFSNTFLVAEVEFLEKSFKFE